MRKCKTLLSRFYRSDLNLLLSRIPMLAFDVQVMEKDNDIGGY